MDGFLPLSALRIGLCDDKICVKVLSLWFDKRDAPNSNFNMILADFNGDKIEGSITQNYYDQLNADAIKEDRWFILSGCEVTDKVKPIRNCKHAYQILITIKTTFLANQNHSDSRYFEFPNSYSELLKGPIGQVFPFDLYGVVKKFSRPERIPYVPREDELDYQEMAVRFEIVDHNGNFMKCCAIGDACVDFMTQWPQYYDLNYSERPKVFTVLQFWRISEIQGEKSAISGVGCSKMALNPELEELRDTKEVSIFTEVFYDVEKEKEDLQWF